MELRHLCLLYKRQRNKARKARSREKNKREKRVFNDEALPINVL